MGEILSTNEKIRRLEERVAELESGPKAVANQESHRLTSNNLDELDKRITELAEQYNIISCQFNGMANAVLGQVGMSPDTIQQLLDNSKEVAQNILNVHKEEHS